MSADNRASCGECGFTPSTHTHAEDCSYHPKRQRARPVIPTAHPDLLATLEARYDALQDRIARYRRKGKPTKELLAIHRADELAEAIAIVRGVK